MTGRPPRTAVYVVVVAVLAVAAGYGLLWYSPWSRLTDTTVNDELTSGYAPDFDSAQDGDETHTIEPQPYRLLSGTFISQQHRTSGTARVIRHPGLRKSTQITLELADFNTTNGPGLSVWLTDQPVKADKSGWRVFDNGRRVELGELKGNKGNQTYEIPVSADLGMVRSVTIWSSRSSVSYGAAALT
jgi:hypothetical protein